jgi:hypothetical protein
MILLVELFLEQFQVVDGEPFHPGGFGKVLQ